jgi:predicted DNA-binding transcriptional regulator AlpA
MGQADSLLEATMFLREQHVLGLLQVSRATLGRWVRDRHFPAPIYLSARIKVWKTPEVRKWIAEHDRMVRAATP